MKRVIKYTLFLLLLLILAGLFYKKVYIPKSTYNTVVSTRGDLSVEIYGIGNVGAKHIYAITAQTGGKIVSIATDEGEWVKKGDLLIVIDSVDVPKLLEESNIAVQKAELEYLASQKELKSLVAQKELARVTYERYKKLKDKSFASKAEYDKAKADFAVVEAQIEASKVRMDAANMEIKKSKKSIEGLEEKLSRYRIYSPVDGLVISKEAEVAQSVLPTQAILKIVDPKSVWVKTYIDEKISGSVKVGQKARIKLRSSYEKYFEGVVKRIVAQSDMVTKEREVDVAFADLPMPFYMNEQAEVSIASKSYANVVKIPANALYYVKGKTGVWIQKEGKASFVQLNVLARNQQEIAVEGIDEGMEILLESANKKPLKEGSSVH